MTMDTNLSPLMRQYFETKNRFPDALVLFQVGDFYELFFDDAINAAGFLGIALTKRGLMNNQPIPLCGVPVHTIDHYLIKLVKGGFRVVVCDQKTKMQPGVKLIERQVTQVLTPGTLTDAAMLDDKSASYLCSIAQEGDRVGLVFVELMTGQVLMTTLDASDAKMRDAELARFIPDEIVCDATCESELKRQGFATTSSSSGYTSIEFNTWLNTVAELVRGFIDHAPAARTALERLYEYLRTNENPALELSKTISFYSPDDYLILDAATQRNLEVVKNSHDGSVSHTLFAILDHAVTAMGSRTIKKWLLRPLVKKEAIEARLDAVDVLVRSVAEREAVVDCFKHVGDIERIIGRIALSRAQLNDYCALMRALEVLPQISRALDTLAVASITALRARVADFSELHALLSAALNDDAGRDYKIKPGFNAELDRLRGLLENSTQAILALERQEQESIGINTLKIRFNRAHGYGIEITKANAAAVPDRYMRLQTLVNRERYTTQELKDLEYDIQRAQNSIREVEDEVFARVVEHVRDQLPALKKTAMALAHLDAFLGLARAARTHGFSRPMFLESRDIVIFDGWHPVVKSTVGESYIPNGATLIDDERVWVITGPNMGGKSTFLRQVAITCLMAQMGSYVPAREARVPLVDRIFTRIGAADNVAEGKSTFLVEMEEAALICTHATSRSLVILDEVGRGTSTYDGLALAQALVEYIYSNVGARCLFATHYHELTALCDVHPGIVSYHAASKETPQGVLLLHKIMKGAAGGSFGLEVAKRAGIPAPVISRAAAILRDVKNNDSQSVLQTPITTDLTFQAAQACDSCVCLKEQIQQVDLNDLSPRAAWDMLSSLKNFVKE